jgi:uncharacterized protein GlcG (DUF336 family)
MDQETKSEIARKLVDGVARIFPELLADPIETAMSSGNAALCVIDDSGRVYGQIFGVDKARGRGCFVYAQRKVVQVWMTGYATGRFEELVYARKLDDKPFGLNRPDFVGWQGGVPLVFTDGSLLAAAFSGFRGEKDIEIIRRAAAAIPGLSVKGD